MWLSTPSTTLSILNSIIRHIEYLLQRNDCVILPGIGAIVAEYVASEIDYETGRITPPCRIIALNTSIVHDDGMLATSISRAEGIKFGEARTLMCHAMAEIRSTLSAEREYPLGRIGMLTEGEEHRITFIPAETPLATSERLGHPIATAIERENVKSASADVPSTDETLPPHTYTRILSDRNYYIAINKIFARSAAAVIVVMALVLPFIMPHTKPAGNLVNASLNPVETLSSPNRTIERTTTPPEEGEAADDAETTPDGGNMETTADVMQVKDNDAQSGYHLIVATFRSSADVEKYIAQHRGTTYPLRGIEKNGMWRVSAACGDKATLRMILNSDDFKREYSKSWIWDAD